MPLRRRRPDGALWWERVAGHQVLVHLRRDEGTNRGFLEEVVPPGEHGPGGVLLSSVEHLPDDGPVIPLGGRLFISHDRIQCIQEPPA